METCGRFCGCWKAYAEYVKAALNTSYILGVFWCNPVDTPKGFGKSGVKQGFFADGLLADLVCMTPYKNLMTTEKNRRHDPVSEGKVDAASFNQLFVQTNNQHE